MAIGHPRYGAQVAPSSRAARPLAVPPSPQLRERTAPDAKVGRMGGVFLSDVGRRVVPICQRPALSDEPGVQVLAAGAAHREDSAVAVGVARLASHDLLPDVIGQCERRLLLAMIRLPGGLAGLPRFRRVDAEQADALAMDFDGVTVDRRGAAGQLRNVGRRRDKTEQGHREDDEAQHSGNTRPVSRLHAAAGRAAPPAVLRRSVRPASGDRWRRLRRPSPQLPCRAPRGPRTMERCLPVFRAEVVVAVRPVTIEDGLQLVVGSIG